MDHENVYYINIKPYYNSLPFEDMAQIYYDNEYNNINKESNQEEFITTITKLMNRYNYDCKVKEINEINIDKIISKQIINYLKDFFSKKNRTIKFKKTKKNKTFKK
tara:strand:+ start:566 stop:883 length:318 start_codon:yes stop_codon:yes gene_type:complete